MTPFRGRNCIGTVGHMLDKSCVCSCCSPWLVLVFLPLFSFIKLDSIATPTVSLLAVSLFVQLFEWKTSETISHYIITSGTYMYPETNTVHRPIKSQSSLPVMQSLLFTIILKKKAV